MSGSRRGGIPGPESRTGLVRPTMTEAEFERQMATAAVDSDRDRDTASRTAPARTEPDQEPDRDREHDAEAELSSKSSSSSSSSSSTNGSSRSRSKGRGSSSGGSKTKRVQRMFAIEEELDKKLWLYAIHVGKDRSEVVNDLLRPLVGSMVLYDSRDRRSNRNNESDSEN